MSPKIVIPPFRVLYADAYNIAFFKKEKEAKKFARTKRLSKIEVEGEYL
jgi:hypothetical protein